MTNIVKIEADFPSDDVKVIEELVQVLKKISKKGKSLFIDVDCVFNGPASEMHEAIINMVRATSCKSDDPNRQTQYCYQVTSDSDVSEDGSPKSTFDVEVFLDMANQVHRLSFVSLVCFYIDMVEYITCNGGHLYFSVRPGCGSDRSHSGGSGWLDCTHEHHRHSEEVKTDDK